MKKPILKMLLALACATAIMHTANATDPVTVPPQPLVVQPASAPQPRVESQTGMGMGNYSMSGMNAGEKSELTRVVKRDRKQLGHGMGGIGATKATKGKRATKSKKHQKRVVSKHKRAKQKVKRVRQ